MQASALPLGHVAMCARQEKGRPNFFSIAGLLTINGADDGVRTRDPDLGKVVLYQLSHVRVARKYNNGTGSGAQVPICHKSKKVRSPADGRTSRADWREGAGGGGRGRPACAPAPREGAPSVRDGRRPAARLSAPARLVPPVASRHHSPFPACASAGSRLPGIGHPRRHFVAGSFAMSAPLCYTAGVSSFSMTP